MIAEVEAQLEKERNFAVNSPMPEPKLAAGGVYCDTELPRPSSRSMRTYRKYV